MSLSLFGLIAILSMTIFAVAAIVFSLKEEHAKSILAAREAEERQRLSEMSILKEIQERVGYSLDVEKVIDVITSSLDNFISYSTASALIINQNNLVFKTYLKEGVNHLFIDKIREMMVQNITSLSQNPLPLTIEQNRSGVTIDEGNPEPVESFFHMPLTVNERVVALITIASTKPNMYNEKEMAILYRITELASQALSRLENVLNVEKGKLMAMIGSLADGVFMIDGNNQLFVINNAAKAFLHVSKEDPNIIDVLSSLPNTYDFGGKIQSVFTTSQPIEEKEVTIAEKTFKVFINPVLDRSDKSNHRVIGVSFLLHDITLEMSLAQMKEDFTNVIVHELRTPLTAIKASAELLTSQKNLQEEQKEKFTHMIAAQANNVLDEVSLILDSAKLDAGLFSVQKTTGNLKEIIEEKLTVFSSQAQGKMVNLTLDYDPTIQPFSFDIHRIGQVLNNLISNSMKFTPAGGTIKVTARNTPGYVTISVSDTGSGIPKEQQHLLFSRFSQAASNNAHKGSGLGLFFIKGVVEAHGGTIKLESEEGQGTTITFTLPLMAEVHDQQTSGRLPVERLVN